MSAESPSAIDHVIVLGGSYAGLSAALQLARARRRVTVLDAGVRRNRFAATSHGFLGQDGRAPGEIVSDARAQLLAYPNVRWVSEQATQARATDGGFAVTTAQGAALHAQRLVLATGVVDELPTIDGLAERWGRSVFHCPYCHGYELQQGKIGVLASGPLAMHQALMLPDWGEVTLFTRSSFEPDAAQRAQLSARGVAIETQPVVRIADAATVELTDGRRLVMAGLFAQSRTHIASPIAQQLGCAVDESPMGTCIRVDEMQATSVPGVFACGDAARMGGNVALAVGAGAMAGVATHRSLLFP